MADRVTDRHVRVYTVNHESRYVVVGNIPAIGVTDAALQRLNLFGDIQQHSVLPPVSRDFTERLLVQYEAVDSARHAKNRMRHKPPVYGSVLSVAYAPQHETAEDTAAKLRARREMIGRRVAPPSTRRFEGRSDHEAMVDTGREDQEEVSVEFIGPRRPDPTQVQQAVNGLEAMVPRAVATDRAKRRRI